MTDINQHALTAEPAKPEQSKAEDALADKQLDNVTGGTKKASPVLTQACATGVHIKEATITG